MIITFLSDFGQQDGYVGAVKGVLKSIAPEAEIIDIAHNVQAFNIAQARYVLNSYCKLYPKGTVHLCVVDPGVGSDRQAVIIQTKDYYFVGPDNGLFDEILQNEDGQLYKIHFDRDKYNATTFHGRDVFAPTAAKLAAGVAPEALAIKVEFNKINARKNIQSDQKEINIPVLFSDHFGNIIFDLKYKQVENRKIQKLSFMQFEFDRILEYYDQVDADSLLFLWNSEKYLELAVNCGSAVGKTGNHFVENKVRITMD